MCAAGEKMSLSYVTSNAGGHVAEPGETGDVNVQCAPLSDILRDHGVTRADFMSIDIEGNEVLALANSDWNSVPIELLLIETNWSNELLDMLLHDAGFWRVSDISYLDDVFIRAPRLLKFASEDAHRRGMDAFLCFSN
jgi:hypothetical protein